MDSGILPLDGLQTFYYGGQFHTVIRGKGLPAAQFLAQISAYQNDAPTARAGISAGRPVGVKVYRRAFFWHIILFQPPEPDSCVRRFLGFGLS